MENTRTIGHVQQRKLHSPDPAAWNRDVFRQRVFDNLVANIDENAGNLLIDPAWRIIKVDHSRCFVRRHDAVRADADRSEPLFERLQALDRATLEREIGDLMEPGTIESPPRRRDRIVQKFPAADRETGRGARPPALTHGRIRIDHAERLGHCV